VPDAGGFPFLVRGHLPTHDWSAGLAYGDRGKRIELKLEADVADERLVTVEHGQRRVGAKAHRPCNDEMLAARNALQSIAA
jgi:hypothetical protein